MGMNTETSSFGSIDENDVQNGQQVELTSVDITAPDGYFSLNDKVNEVMATLRGRLWFLRLGLKIRRSLRGKLSAKKLKAIRVEMRGLIEMMGEVAVIRLMSVISSVKVSFMGDELLKMNEQLNKIKKPKK